jgi:hypothetical protein
MSLRFPCLFAIALPLPLQKTQTKPGPDQPHQEPGEVHLAGLPGRLVRTFGSTCVGMKCCSATIPSRLRGLGNWFATFFLPFIISSFPCLNDFLHLSSAFKILVSMSLPSLRFLIKAFCICLAIHFLCFWVQHCSGCCLSSSLLMTVSVSLQV